MKMHGKKMYRYGDIEKRDSTRQFFTAHPYQLDKAFYKDNEATFFKLVHNTVKDSELVEKFEIAPIPEFSVVMNAVFGKMPNKKNLKLFFENPVIEYLWWD